MKPFVGLAGLFLLFSQMKLQEFPITVSCSPDHLLVVVERDFFQNGTILHPNQTYLGSGCPVTTVLPYHFYMSYSAFECGIYREVEGNRICFHSALHVFNPRITVPLMCILVHYRPFIPSPVSRNPLPPIPGKNGLDTTSVPVVTGLFISKAQQDIGCMEAGIGHQNPGVRA
ncbi:oocyte-secreted protein 3-like [Monodelphis domestica]|uniref:oocyte-secreted protein 3-like n=1 Tax=Monodelphis domestica TaxID=13616 RepID=UPI0024E21616|nr:oocyte-secreted protein 3-like [Monodelphis domestica]